MRAHCVGEPADTERHINLMDAYGQRISLFITQPSPQLAVDQA